jgi:hypothetical protein
MNYPKRKIYSQQDEAIIFHFFYTKNDPCMEPYGMLVIHANTSFTGTVKKTIYTPGMQGQEFLEINDSSRCEQ